MENALYKLPHRLIWENAVALTNRLYPRGRFNNPGGPIRS